MHEHYEGMPGMTAPPPKKPAAPAQKTSPPGKALRDEAPAPKHPTPKPKPKRSLP